MESAVVCLDFIYTSPVATGEMTEIARVYVRVSFTKLTSQNHIIGFQRQQFHIPPRH